MDSKTVIDESNGVFHPIRPDHINTGRRFWNAFGNTETEVSAYWIVRLFQINLTGWLPFSYEIIEASYQAEGHKNFLFNRLLDDKMVVRDEDGKYRVTHEFICRCFMSSPADLPQT